jgi:hypothetical protein
VFDRIADNKSDNAWLFQLQSRYLIFGVWVSNKAYKYVEDTLTSLVADAGNPLDLSLICRDFVHKALTCLWTKSEICKVYLKGLRPVGQKRMTVLESEFNNDVIFLNPKSLWILLHHNAGWIINELLKLKNA